MTDCTICSNPLDDDYVAYEIGSMRGHMCKACGGSFEKAVTKWAAKRVNEVRLEREQAASQARKEQERAAESVLAKEIAQSRMAQLMREGTPFATPERVRGTKGRAA